MHPDEIGYTSHLLPTLLFYSIYRIEAAKDDSGSSIRAPQGSLPYLSMGGDEGRRGREGEERVIVSSIQQQWVATKILQRLFTQTQTQLSILGTYPHFRYVC